MKKTFIALILISIGFIWGFLAHRNHIFPYNLFIDNARSLLVTPKPKLDPWPQQVKDIITHQDHRAMVYISNDKNVPLIVDLHPWDGSHRQFIHAAVNDVLKQNWHYCHPDFGGPNWKPGTLLSEQVIEDIDLSIDYMIKRIGHTPKIVVVGVSGGGLASLAYQMQSKYSIDACIAWAPLTKLDDFYFQSQKQRHPFAGHILSSTGLTEGTQLFEVLKKRSPFFILKHKKKLCPTIIYSGATDPIIPLSQTIEFYNLYDEFNGSKNQVSNVDERKLAMHLPMKFTETPIKHSNSQIIYLKKSYNLELRIHDGGHEKFSQLIFEDTTTLLNLSN